MARKVILNCPPEDARTKQSQAAEADINNILARYSRTKMIEHVARGIPQFIDVSETGDYKTAIDRVRAADAWFNGLPATVRAFFKNDVAGFMDFMGNPENEAKARELGLVPAAGAPAPAVPVAEDLEHTHTTTHSHPG